MNRREFLAGVGALAVAAALPKGTAQAISPVTYEDVARTLEAGRGSPQCWDNFGISAQRDESESGRYILPYGDYAWLAGMTFKNVVVRLGSHCTVSGCIFENAYIEAHGEANKIRWCTFS